MKIMYENLMRCMNIAWRIKSGREGVAQVGESEIALMNTGFKGKCHTSGKYGHKQNNCPNKNKSEKEKGKKKLTSKCNHFGKVGHKATKLLGT